MNRLDDENDNKTPRIENPSRLVGRLREALFPLNDQALIRSSALCIEHLASEFDRLERELADAKIALEQINRAHHVEHRRADEAEAALSATRASEPDWEGAFRTLLAGCGRSDETDAVIEAGRAFLLKHRTTDRTAKP